PRSSPIPDSVGIRWLKTSMPFRNAPASCAGPRGPGPPPIAQSSCAPGPRCFLSTLPILAHSAIFPLAWSPIFPLCLDRRAILVLPGILKRVVAGLFHPHALQLGFREVFQSLKNLHADDFRRRHFPAKLQNV